MPVIGVDLGGTKLAAALFSEDGDLLMRIVEPIDGRDVVDLVVNSVREAGADHAVSGVGMCVPGIYYPRSGRVWAPNIPGWDDYPLLERLQSRLRLEIRIENDRSCSILGEIWKGAARNCTDAVFLAVGTGIGAGIVSGGRIITGRSGIAGAAGWLGLERPFRDRYTGIGCFEYQASGDGLGRMTRDLMDESYAGPLRRSAVVSSEDVFRAADEGDPLAVNVIDNAVELWGMAVANLVSLLNPEKIIFGGGVFGPALKLLPRIRSEAEKWAQPVGMRETEVEASMLEGYAALYGAARLALVRDDYE